MPFHIIPVHWKLHSRVSTPLDTPQLRSPNLCPQLSLMRRSKRVVKISVLVSSGSICRPTRSSRRYVGTRWNHVASAASISATTVLRRSHLETYIVGISVSRAIKVIVITTHDLHDTVAPRLTFPLEGQDCGELVVGSCRMQQLGVCILGVRKYTASLVFAGTLDAHGREHSCLCTVHRIFTWAQVLRQLCGNFRLTEELCSPAGTLREVEAQNV